MNNNDNNNNKKNKNNNCNFGFSFKEIHFSSLISTKLIISLQEIFSKYIQIKGL